MPTCVAAGVAGAGVGVGWRGTRTTAAGVAVAVGNGLVGVGKGGRGCAGFLATRGDDTLVLRDEMMDDDRDLGRWVVAPAPAPAPTPVPAPAPARLFDGLAAEVESGLVLGERGVRGVRGVRGLLREFLRDLDSFNERSRPIRGRAGVARPPSVVVVISGRGRAGVEGVLARFFGSGRGGFSFMRPRVVTGRRMVMAGDLMEILVGVWVLAEIRDLRGARAGAGVLWESSGMGFGLRTGIGMREGGEGEGSVEVGLAWYRGGGSRVASGVLQIALWVSKLGLEVIGEAERGPRMRCWW